MSKTKAFQRKAHAATPPLDEKEIIGLDHPIVTEAMVKKMLPEGPRIVISDLQAVVTLLVNSAAYNGAPVGGLRAIAGRLNAALERDFRAAQEAHLKATGKARP